MVYIEQISNYGEMFILVGLCWLHRLPQIILCGEMKKKTPANEPKKRYRDLVSIDIQNLNLSYSWQDLCLDRESCYRMGHPSCVLLRVVCCKQLTFR